jgi:hypothetical protein
MRYSSRPRRRRAIYAVRPSNRLSTWLSYLGVLLLGAGITAIGLNWTRPSPDSYNPPLLPTGVERDRIASSPAAPDRPNSETDQSDARRSANTPADVRSATVCVVGFIPNGGEVCASGVSIDPELAGIDAAEGSVVLTNYHVVANTGDRPPVKLGGIGQQYEAEVINRSPEMDLALLFVPGVRFPVAALADVSPAGGTPVRAIGFPRNSALTTKDSTLLGFTQNCLAIAPCLAIKQNTITHGNSGGPLEADGRVIGITQGETTEEIAIPVEQVRQFLSGEIPVNPVAPRFEPGYPPGPPGPPPRRIAPPPYGAPPPPGWWR